MNTKLGIVYTFFFMFPVLAMEPLEETGHSPETRRLFECLRNKDLPIDLHRLNELIGLGADVNATRPDVNGFTPLMYAIDADHSEACKLLIKSGANVDALDKRGLTALCWAAALGKEEACSLLIEEDAEINVRNYRGHPPLFCAAKCNHLNICRLLIDSGAKVNPMGFARSALESAASAGNFDICKLLLDSGAKLRFALINAATEGHVEICKLLIERGANVFSKLLRKTPLARGAEHGHLNICQLLVASDVDPNNPEKHYPKSPLYYAAAHNRLAVCQLLLEHSFILPQHNKEETQKIRKDIVVILWTLRHLEPKLNKELQLMIVVRACNEDFLKAVLPLGRYPFPHCIPFIAKCLTKSTVSIITPFLRMARKASDSDGIKALLDPETLEKRVGEKMQANIVKRLTNHLILRKVQDEH